MSHIVLLGDSIFDNGVYVPDGPAVIDQLRALLPGGWQATLLAIDGDVTSDVAGQLTNLPGNTTHLVVSVGGNDALGYSSIFERPAASAVEVFGKLAEIRQRFCRDYKRMVEAVQACGKPAVCCTIYDAVPFAEEAMRRLAVTALPIFNDVILRAAICARVPIIDLREICDQPEDYAPISPIEPSEVGGAKIAAAIAHVVTAHDFSRSECVVYPGP